jgi:ribosomal RNA assembly protein
MQESILIPQERVAALIGKGGSSRKEIEKKGGVKLWVDSNSNEITINGNDVDKLYFAKQVIELVGRGFAPKNACKLFDDKYCAEIIDITDFGAKEKKARQRILGRLIGTKGKSKNIIEKETNTEIVVFGKTVAILGKAEDVEHARRAVEALLSGSQYGSAFKFLKDKE